MPTLKEKHAAKVKEAMDLVEKSQSGVELSAEETASMKKLTEEAVELKKRIDENDALESKLFSLNDGSHLTGGAKSEGMGAIGTKSLGNFAFEALSESGVLAGIKSGAALRGSTTEYKAPGDTVLVPGALGTTTQMLLPDIDRSIVRNYVQGPTVASWLGAGTIASNAITYFVERVWDNEANGTFKTVAEGAAKPGLTPPAYDQVTETLKKIAGWIKLSMEMAEDADFLVSEINNRLLLQLTLAEEEQLLRGDGVGTNIKGLLNRDGLLTKTIATADGNLDGIYDAMNQVFLKTGIRVDGMVMNPADYQKIRLAKDANSQYYAGGPFTGQYGNGGVMQEPPIWGIPVIQTTAIEAGTVLIGAGKQGATVYRKGGVRVEASNVDRDDFTNNLFTVLVEERLTLAVRKPDAFIKVTLGV